MRGQAGSLHVEDLYPEGAQADEHVASRVGRVRGVAVPAIERGHAVLVGPHALPCDHVEAFAGQGRRAPRASSNSPASSSSLAWWGFLPSSRHLPGSPELKFSRLHTLGLGTNGLRRTMPTFASTAPFSCPVYGEHRELSNP